MRPRHLQIDHGRSFPRFYKLLQKAVFINAALKVAKNGQTLGHKFIQKNHFDNQLRTCQ
jgi:hypothetical protein